jgi:hypothetical protein
MQNFRNSVITSWFIYIAHVTFLFSFDCKSSFSVGATVGEDGAGTYKVRPSSKGTSSSILRTQGTDSFDPNWAVLVSIYSCIFSLVYFWQECF